MKVEQRHRDFIKEFNELCMKHNMHIARVYNIDDYFEGMKIEDGWEEDRILTEDLNSILIDL